MAGALVGGSFLSAFLQVLFDRIASPKIVDFFRGQKLNDGLLKKLNTTMISVSGVLDDAEEKQITKPAVKKWLDELKDAVYEADDLLDEIACGALGLELETGCSHSSTDQVRHFFSSFNPFKKCMEMEEKLRDILDRLEYLVGQKDALGLIEGIGENPSSQRIPTTCLVDEFGVYGRDADKEGIMRLVMSDGSELGVIPIVGMGGVGKTTLAQLVYNDNRVQQLFYVKAWVCVSEEFDVSTVTKDIIEEVTGKPCDVETLNQRQLMLKKRLMGKRFFLVLDDVWNDKHADWDRLLRPLKFGARGSKIVVTTRNESVASVMQTVPTHYLKELSDDDCWLLFAKHAFDGGSSGAYPQLEIIGRELVKKCKGLPLAAKTLGAALRCKRDTNEWEKIVKSDKWCLSHNNILPALRLSYQYLPSHLKRCFAYCSLFPKDYEFEREELVLLWMAEGFLVQCNGNKEIEVGGEYFDDLVSRSFFQQSVEYRSHFLMHDLINDLAKFASGEFCFRLEGDNACTVAKMTRHFSYVRTKNDASKKFGAVCEAKFLRTFLPVEPSRSCSLNSPIGDELMHDLLPKLGYLRVLSLPLHKKIIKLPDSIGDLKHLRYLNLHGASIERLPETVSSLYNLQTLILLECRNLVELPMTMGKLINLCHLDIRETKLQEMPPDMGKLKALQILTNFILGDYSGSRIKELGELQHIQGTLDICDLQHVVDPQDALEANVKGKEQLKGLKLTWNGDCDDSLRARCLLEHLEPPKKVETLTISGYGGTIFPNWLGDSAFSNMVHLSLYSCKNCSSLPPLGQLVSLKFLFISEFDGVVAVGPEFYGSCTSMMKPFRSLESLVFYRMAIWQEWISDVHENGGEAFPLLRQLCITSCPNLTKALPSHLPSLLRLKISECQQLATTLPRAAAICELELNDKSHDLYLEQLDSGLYFLSAQYIYSLDFLIKEMELVGCFPGTLERLSISSCNALESFPLKLFPKLESLSLNSCFYLESLLTSGVTPGAIRCLDYLTIQNCPSFLSFPEGGLPAPNLKHLQLNHCSNLKSLPENMHSLLPSLEQLTIENCPELESFPEEKLPCRLESLDIKSCNKLIASCSHWEKQELPSLSRFNISMFEDVESFPEEILLPSTLTSLRMCNLQNLISLDSKGLQHLTSLKELNISDCPNLVSFPKGGLHATNLACLYLKGCLNLKSLPEGGFPLSLQLLNIHSCDKLISGRMQWNLQMLPSLSDFSIGMYDDLECFPDESFLPSTLTSLKIQDLQNLKSLDSKGLKLLNSLQSLTIRNCPKLQSMPEEGLPSSLNSLSIYNCSKLQSMPEKGLPSSLCCLTINNCPLLEKKCKTETGEYWPKISHIPHVWINFPFPEF